MPNPYSQYTGTRISPVPSGFLQATGQMASDMQKGLAGMGQQIGEGIAKYYEGKEEEKQVAMIRAFDKDFYDAITGQVTPPEPMRIYGAWHDKHSPDRKTQAAVFTRAVHLSELQSQKKLNDALIEKHGRSLAEPKTDAQRNWEYLRALLEADGIPQKEQQRQRRKIFGSEKTTTSDTETGKQKEWAGTILPRLIKNKAEPEEIQSKFNIHFGLVPEEGTSAMRDNFSLVDEIGEALNWDAKTIATRKNELLAKFPTKDAPPDKIQQLAAIRDTLWYRNAPKGQQAIWDRKFHGIEDPSQTTDQQNWAKIEPDLLKRLKDDPDFGNKEFAARYDEFWGLTPPAGTTSDLEIRLNRLDAMDLSPEERKQAVLEAMNARVAPVKPTAKMQEYEYFKNLLDPALHDRFTRETAGLTPTEVDLKKDVVTWLTGTGIAEGDAVRMSMGRDISSVTKAQQHITLLKSIEEKFELGEFTREEADMQAFMTNEFAGIPTAGDLKSQRLSNELKQKELEKEAKLLEALQDPNSKPEMMDTPLPNYKYMRKPPSTNWTLVNISQGGAKITRQVSKAMADKLNIDLEKQGIKYRWQFDATDPRTGGTYMYKPTGAYGDHFDRAVIPPYKPGERFVPEEIPPTQEAPMQAPPPIPSPKAPGDQAQLVPGQSVSGNKVTFTAGTTSVTVEADKPFERDGEQFIIRINSEGKAYIEKATP